MKVFVTDPTGFLGSRVLPLLAKAGHEVTALIREPEDAENLKARNVQPVLGDLHSLDVIAQAALEADAVLHLAFIHDFSNYSESCLVDVRVSETVIKALEGSVKPYVFASASIAAGELTLGLTDETAAVSDSEAAALKGVENGVKVMVMRLPMYVYDNSFFCSFMLDVQTQAAQRSGAATYIGSGQHKVSAVHVEDAAVAYIFALTAGAAGSIFNIAGEQGVTYQQIATAIADKLGTDIRPIDGAPIQAVGGTSLPVRSITQEEAAQLYGSPSFAQLFSMSNDLDATKTREELRWKPVHTSGFTAAIANVKPTEVPVGAAPTEVGG